ncbi:MAG: hypothetical protein Q613_PSC00339G0002 [Propionibacterium sp. DORA_15]|nr:MAG: hypothetical protein Q613_PSC00339G0002 [Propionibacterium sp. DORA_15]
MAAKVLPVPSPGSVLGLSGAGASAVAFLHRWLCFRPDLHQHPGELHIAARQWIRGLLAWLPRRQERGRDGLCDDRHHDLGHPAYDDDPRDCIRGIQCGSFCDGVADVNDGVCGGLCLGVYP